MSPPEDAYDPETEWALARANGAMTEGEYEIARRNSEALSASGAKRLRAQAERLWAEHGPPEPLTEAEEGALREHSTYSVSKADRLRALAREVRGEDAEDPAIAEPNVVRVDFVNHRRVHADY
jgi:hypothetical protein